jgi:hypothetical protein
LPSNTKFHLFICWWCNMGFCEKGAHALSSPNLFSSQMSVSNMPLRYFNHVLESCWNGYLWEAYLLFSFLLLLDLIKCLLQLHLACLTIRN